MNAIEVRTRLGHIQRLAKPLGPDGSTNVWVDFRAGTWQVVVVVTFDRTHNPTQRLCDGTADILSDAFALAEKGVTALLKAQAAATRDALEASARAAILWKPASPTATRRASRPSPKPIGRRPSRRTSRSSSLADSRTRDK